jgi:hypothetical protein
MKISFNHMESTMKSFLRFSCSTFAILMLALVISGAQSAFAQNTIIYGVTTSNSLVSFSSANPGTLLNGIIPISGLEEDENILGIDFRPATGQLFGLSSMGRLYLISTIGAATPVSAAGAFTLNGTEFGFDFNPVPDRIRVNSDADQNLRLNPNNGTLTAMDGTLAYASGDVNAGTNPNVVAAGYANSFAGTTTTTLYDIDSNLDILATQNPPNVGTLNTVGALGVNISNVAGFDIATSLNGTTNTAYAALNPESTATSNLYTIDLATGRATQVGTTPIGGTGGPLIRGIAVPPFIRGIVISEFRFRGPSGAADEFIEIANTTNLPITVVSTDPTPAVTQPSGWGIGNLQGSGNASSLAVGIPNGTEIPARGHFLAINNSGSYSLNGYPGGQLGFGSGTNPDRPFLVSGITDNTGIGLFTTNVVANFSSTTRLDSVAFTGAGSQRSLYLEGTGLTPISTSLAAGDQFSLVRRMTGGLPQDLNDNAADFVLVSTSGVVGTTQAVLGAPGPEGAGSPAQRNSDIKASLIFPCTGLGVDGTGCQNRNRGTTPVTNGQFGTLTIRRRFTNMTGSNITRLRFRIVDMTTAPAAPDSADLRALSSNEVIINDFAIQGTTLEMPPAQPNGGGLNSSLSCCNGSLGQVTLTNPLVSGGSIDVQFVLGVQQNGNYRFFVNVEALPANSGATAPSKTKVQRNVSKSAN